MADDEKLEPNDEAAPASAPAGENDVLTGLAAQVAELRDKYLRAVAEAENVRKRAERDVADARAYGITAFARDVLAVDDNLARAIEAVDADARASASGTLRALLDGVELTHRELLKALERYGVRRLDPLGEKFDPNFHQAMFELPAPDAPAGTVVQVMQPGYAIGERVLRPALVAVAKGGPKAAPANDQTQTAGPAAK
jgi:molecular chaperone GrpE